MANTLLLLTIFSVPLLTPIFGLGYEQVKVCAFLILVSIIGLIWLLDQAKHPKLHNFRYSRMKIAAVFFILVLFLTSLLGIDPLNSIIGRQPYYQGFIVYAYLLFFSFLVSVYELNLTDISKAISTSSLVVSLFALRDLILFKVFNQNIPLYSDRVVSTFGQPNFYAGFLLISLPFTYFLCFQSGIGKPKFWRTISSLSLLSSVLAIGISGSRSSEILLFLAILTALFGYIKSSLKWFLLGVVIATFGVILFFSLNLSTGIIYKEYLVPINNNIHGIYRTSPEKRAYIWPIIFQLIKQSPVLGYGLDNLIIIYPRYFDQFRVELGPLPIPYYDLRNLVVDRSHNYLLDLLIFSGVLGLLGWLGIVLLVIKKLLPTTNYQLSTEILLVSLILYLAFIQFQNQSIVHLIQFWMLLGLVDESKL